MTATLAAVLAACGGDSAPETTSTPEPPGLAGVYAGELPCDNCAAISATLWLRPDGAFVFRQRYAATGNTPAESVYGLGRWQWNPAEARIVLGGSGPERRLEHVDTQRLRLLSAVPGEHVLARDAQAPMFTDRVPLDGVVTIDGSVAMFKECRTGLAFPIAAGGVFADLRRQYRRTSKPGADVLADIEGHLAAAGGAETLTIDRIDSLRPGGGC